MVIRESYKGITGARAGEVIMMGMSDSLVDVAKEFWKEHKREEVLGMGEEERRAYVCGWVDRKVWERVARGDEWDRERKKAGWLISADIMAGLQNGTRGILGKDDKKRRGVQRKAFYEGVIGKRR